MNVLNSLPLSIVVVLCLTLGLAPFSPEPHIWEKLKMLVSGGLVKPVDIFDLLMHSFPFLLLALRTDLAGTAAFVFGWSFAIWGIGLYLFTGVSYFLTALRAIRVAR